MSLAKSLCDFKDVEVQKKASFAPVVLYGSGHNTPTINIVLFSKSFFCGGDFECAVGSKCRATGSLVQSHVPSTRQQGWLGRLTTMVRWLHVGP